jgi:hypothetical protein
MRRTFRVKQVKLRAENARLEREVEAEYAECVRAGQIVELPDSETTTSEDQENEPE